MSRVTLHVAVSAEDVSMESNPVWAFSTALSRLGERRYLVRGTIVSPTVWISSEEVISIKLTDMERL